MTPAFAAACRAEETIERVQRRLAAMGAVTELDVLAGFSAQETDWLLRLEREAR